MIKKGLVKVAKTVMAVPALLEIPRMTVMVVQDIPKVTDIPEMTTNPQQSLVLTVAPSVQFRLFPVTTNQYTVETVLETTSHRILAVTGTLGTTDIPEMTTNPQQSLVLTVAPSVQFRLFPVTTNQSTVTTVLETTSHRILAVTGTLGTTDIPKVTVTPEMTTNPQQSLVLTVAPSVQFRLFPVTTNQSTVTTVLETTSHRILAVTGTLGTTEILAVNKEEMKKILDRLLEINTLGLHPDQENQKMTSFLKNKKSFLPTARTNFMLQSKKNYMKFLVARHVLAAVLRTSGL